MSVRRRVLVTVGVLLSVLLLAILWCIYYFCSVTYYDSVTWWMVPPPRIELSGAGTYERVASEGSPDYEALVARYGAPRSSDRLWPLPFGVDASQRGGCMEPVTPRVYYVHPFIGSTQAYLLDGCLG